MQLNLRIAIWNANGVSNHKNEIEIFLSSNFIDILLISETHLTTKSYFKISGYDIVNANHPNNSARGGSAVIIKSNIKYETMQEIKLPYLQAAGVKIKCDAESVVIYSIYFPPRHLVNCNEFHQFFSSLGHKFIVGGDFNSKHPWWGSRLINPKGRELYKCVRKYNYSILSTGNPTYWPSDPNKIPDLMDFAVYKNIPHHLLDIVDCDDLQSDHSPLIINFNTKILQIAKSRKMLTPKTDIKYFQDYISANVKLNLSITNDVELDDAVEFFTKTIHEAAHNANPKTYQEQQRNKFSVQVSIDIKRFIKFKRRLRRIWKNTRHPTDKRNLNKATAELKQMLAEYKNDQTSSYLKSLDPHSNSENCLWYATKYLKRPCKRNPPIKDHSGNWCRSDKQKADAFGMHLEDTFRPFTRDAVEDISEMESFLNAPLQMDLPIKHISPQEVQEIISAQNLKKAPGYDGIDGTVLKALPFKAVIFLTLIYNAILRLSHFPSQWKCAKIIMVLKPNKEEHTLTSYRPISLLSIFSKMFERLLLKRVEPLIRNKNIIPQHQFGFRRKHGTPEQCHRVAKVIRESLESKKYCTAVFLDIQQAFDRVWHLGLLFKLKNMFPAPVYSLLKSYLENRNYYVSIRDECSEIYNINAGVPQGSVLSPILYTLYTADMPTAENICTATYADDTALLAVDESPTEASSILQRHLYSIEEWLKKWNIRVNATKSAHITFSLRKEATPTINLNRIPIPQVDCVKYLGIHMDKRLTWGAHVKAKRNQLNLKTKKMYWLLGYKSELSTENKLLLYKALLKPIWTYGLELWGSASNSNVEIIQRYQSKTLRMIMKAPWYITNKNIHSDVNMKTVAEEIKSRSSKYLARLHNHVNVLAITLLDESQEIKRLKRRKILDLPF